jgi:hypothetical protein
MKLAIVGSRSITDYNTIFKCVNDAVNINNIDCIISGGARGVDSLAVKLAITQGIPYKEILPDWNTHGRSAGMIRNKDIILAADAVIAFWDGVSRGTLNSINHAKKMKKVLYIFNQKGESITV